MKTILSRITKASAAAGTLAEDISKAEGSLRSVGVEVRDSAGEFRDMTDIMSDLGGVWDSLDSVAQSNISFEVAGTRQVNIIKSLLSNWEQYEDLVTKADDSAGTTLENQNKYALSLKGKLAELSTIWDSIKDGVINSELLSSLVNMGTGVSKLIDQFGLLNTAVLAFTTVSSVRNGGMINTWYKDLMKVQTVLNSMKNIEIIGSGALAPATVTSLSTAISGLSKEQAVLALSTKGVTGARAEQVLVDAGLIASTNSISTSLMREALSNTTLDAVEQKSIMTKLGLTTATATCTKAKFDEVIANTTLSASETNAIASQLGLTTANASTMVSVNLLTASIWANVKAMAAWLISNPVGWAILAGGAIFGLSKLYKSNTERLQENQEALEKQKGEYDSVTTKVTTLETELKSCQDRLTELNSLGGANVVKDGEQAKLEAQTEELQRQLDIEKEAQRIAGLKAEKTAVKTLDTKNRMKYGIDIGQRQNAFKPVTMGEELSITMSEYDKVLAKYKELETEQQKLAKDKKGKSSQFKVNENELANLSAKMTEFEAYANELATGVQTASDSINGATGEVGEKAKAEATSVLGSYSSWIKGLNTVSNAETDLATTTSNTANSVSTSANTIANAFSFTDSAEGIDAYQSSISALKTAQDALNDGSFSATDLVDLLQQFPELEGKTDNLSSAIQTLAQDKLKALLSQLGESAPPELKESLTEMITLMGGVTDSSSDMANAISSIKSVSEGLSTLDSAMAKIKSDSEELNFDDIVSLQEQFGNLDGFDDFISTITNSASTAEETQQAFNNLTSEYINNSGALDNLNFATADLVAQQLQEMGIANAQEVVYAQLGVTKEQYAQVTAYCTANGIDLTNATYQEIQALVQETGISQQAAQQMYIFALRKALANENVLSTSSDIQNLMSLITALGGTTSALQAYYNAKNSSTMAGVGSDGMKAMYQAAQEEANNALTTAQSALSATSNLANVNFQGGAQTADALADNLKNVEDKAKDATDALKEAYDAYMKLMSHKEAMGIYDNDPMEYVKDLQTLVNDYVYDQDTAWEAEEKIYEAREKYMDEWISKAKEVYSSYIDMLDTLQQQLENKIEFNGNKSTSKEFKQYLNTFKDEAKAYADARNYLQQQLNDYLESGGKKGDSRWNDLTQAIADANGQIDEVKLNLKSAVEDYTSDWADAIKNVFDEQITYAEKYQDRLESLYELTGDTKYKDDALKNSLDTLSLYQQKYAEQQKAINEGLSSGTISTNSKDGYKYEEYLDLSKALDETKDSINDLKVNLKDFADTAVSDWIGSIENLGSSVEGLMNSYQGKLDAQISLLEASGDKVGSAIYEALIKSTNQELGVLQTRKQVAQQNLDSGIDNGTIVKGSDAWQDLVTVINETDDSINQCNQDIVEYNNSLMELDFSKFDDFKKILDSISDEMGDMISAIDGAGTDLVNNADASLSKEGLATLALQLQQREASIYALQQVKAEIASLNADYANGSNGMSETEYAERLAELKAQQYELTEKQQSAEQSVLDIYEEQKEAQIQLIQDKIDALQEENDERQRALDLQKAQYALEQAMNNRNKMVFTGKEFEYTVDQSAVDDARSNLSDLQLQSQVADLEKQIKALEAQVPVLSDILDNAINLVNDNATEVYESLMEYSEKYGITISDYIITAWNGVIDSETGATLALTQFGITVTNTSSKSVSSLHRVKSKVDEIYSSANVTARQIVTMLTPSTQYIEEKLGLISYDITVIANNANIANGAINAWNNISLATFNQTTAVASNGVADITTKANIANGALNALNSINVYTNTGTTKKSVEDLKSGISGAKDEVNLLKDAVDKLGDINISFKQDGMSKIKSDYEAIKDKEVHIKYIQDIHTAQYRIAGVKDGFSSYAEAWNWMANHIPSGYGAGLVIEAYANGGMVGNKGMGSALDQAAQSVGEHHMVAVQPKESILTAKETKGYQDFAGMTPDLVNTFKPLVDLGKLDISNLVSNKTQPSYSPSFTIASGAIVLQNVNDVDGLSTAIIHELPNRMLQQMHKTQ